MVACIEDPVMIKKILLKEEVGGTTCGRRQFPKLKKSD